MCKTSVPDASRGRQCPSSSWPSRDLRIWAHLLGFICVSSLFWLIPFPLFSSPFSPAWVCPACGALQWRAPAVAMPMMPIFVFTSNVVTLGFHFQLWLQRKNLPLTLRPLRHVWPLCFLPKRNMINKNQLEKQLSQFSFLLLIYPQKHDVDNPSSSL